MARPLRGILSALSTPFSSDLAKIDEPTLRDLVDVTLAAGIHGLIPCGGTGEFVSLTTEERKQVAEIVVDQAAGRVPVVPHTGHTSTQVVVELSRHAESIGADAVMVMFPYGEPVSQQEVYAFYQDISEAVHIPIMVYNIPSITGQNLPPAFLATMAREIEHVRYVKDSSADLSQVQELLYRYGDVITPFNGWDTLTYPSLLLGCTGAVWGAPNLAPTECAQLFNLIESGKLPEAKALWDRLWPVMDFLGKHSYNAAVKAGANLHGFRVGIPRRPTLPLSPEHSERLKQLMAQAGILA